MITQMKNTAWVIVPAYNESEYLDKVLPKLSSQWKQFILVDDGSSDDTSKIAHRYTPHVLIHQINLGKGAALKTGCEYAFNELQATDVVFFDADDQHDAKYIADMVTLLDTVPVVFGVRAFNNQMPLLRIMLNRVASIITLIFFGQYIPDIPSGFKALSKSAYQKIKWTSSDYSVEMEIAARVAQYKIPFEVVNIPTIYHDLDRGMTLLDILHMAFNVITWKVKR